MESTKPHFFQVMYGDFKHRLHIPQGFLKYICNISSDRVVLQGPNGRSYVKLNRTSCGTFLEDGWGSFSRVHSLSTAEFVMLRFDGYEHFSVRIFGINGVERDTTCRVTNSRNVNKGEEIKTCARPPIAGRMIHNETPSPIVVSSSNTQNAEDHQKKCLLERKKTRNFDRSDSEVEGINHKRPIFLEHCNQNAEHREDYCMLERVPDLFYQSDSFKGTSSDTSEEGEAIETTKMLTDKSPSFSITMQPSYRYYLPIPRSFSNQYVMKDYEAVILALRDGRTWYTECRKRKDNYRLCTGWRDFRKDLQLTDGSVCVFEMIKRKSFVLKVHICREA